jgi:uncharacterized membrane protein
MEFILLIIAIFIIASLHKRIGFLDNALKTINKEVEKLKIEVASLQNQSIRPQSNLSQERVIEDKITSSVQSVAISKSDPASIISQPNKTISEVQPVSGSIPQIIKKDENQFNLIEWIKKDFLVKVGGFFMVIALAWFVSFAFANDWIGPEGRVSIGVLVGAMLMVVGYWQLPKNPAPARIITLVGTTTILVTLYTAQAILGLFNPTIILFGMVITIAFTVLISIIHDSRSIGIIAMTGSYAVPFLTGSTTSDISGLFIYITVINIASLALVYTKGWRVLQLISMLITFSLSNFLGILGADSVINKWLYLCIFIALFQFSSIYAIIKTKKLIRMDIINSIISTIVSISWVTTYVNLEFRTLSFVGLSIATFGIAVFLDRNQATKYYIYVQLIASLTTLVFATYLQFVDNPTAFIIAFTFEVLGSQWLFSKLFEDNKAFHILPFLHIVPITYFLTLSSEAVNLDNYIRWTSSTISTTDLMRNIVLNIFLIAAVYINSSLIDYAVIKEKIMVTYSKTLKLISVGLGFILLLNIHAIIAAFYNLSSYQVVNYSVPILLLVCTILSLGLVLYKPMMSSKLYSGFAFILLYNTTGLQMLQMINVDSPEKIIVWFTFTILGIATLAQTSILKDKRFEYLGYSLLVGSMLLQLTTNLIQSDSGLRVVVYVVALLISLYLRLSSQFDKQYFTQRVSDISLGFILLVLVFIELWALGIVIRIITFVAVGGLLILTGFAKKKS